MHNKRQPLGHHCTSFDMHLLQQVVDVEVDLLVRRLLRDHGIVIDSAVQAQWTASVCERIAKVTFAEISTHSFLPSVMNHRLQMEIERLMREEVHISRRREEDMHNKASFGLSTIFTKFGSAVQLYLEKQVE